jgi:hypothetical protein
LHSDDLQNFQSRSCDPPLGDKGIVATALPSIRGWMSIGRITPLAFVWMEFAFQYFKTIAGYKIFVVTVNMLAVLMFLLLIRSLRIPVNPAVWMVFFAGVMQFRLQFHDAFSSLNAQYPFLAVLIFSSLIFYTLYIKRRNGFYLALSILLYISGIFLSEVGLTALFLIPFCAWHLNAKPSIYVKTLSIYFCIAILYVGSVLWIRHNLSGANIWYEGLQTNYETEAMLTLWLKQVYAALPLSNLDHQIAIPLVLFHQLTSAANIIAVALLAIMAVGIFWIYNKSRGSEPAPGLKSFLFALILWMVPALFIIPSVKYQLSVRLGVGYLPVYLQNFGSATLLACLFQYAFQNQQRVFKSFSYLLYGFATVALLAAFLFNLALVRAKYFEHEFPSMSQLTFIKSGAFNHCEEGSTIVLERSYFWRSPQAYEEIVKECAGIDFNFQEMEVYDPEKVPAGKKCYFLQNTGGNVVTMGLYNMDCKTGFKEGLLASAKYKNEVDLIPEEKIILHR